MDDERTPAEGSTLPKYVRFARSLALVSGAAIGLGIGVGATVFTAAGCDQGCTGICTGIFIDPDAGSGWRPDRFDPDARDGGDAGGDSTPTADGGTGGGPLPAPPLPAAWLA